MDFNGKLATGTIRTRMTKTSTPVETKITLDFTGVSVEDLMPAASATIVIDEQAVFRNSNIPSEHVVKVAEWLKQPRGTGGFKPTPENMAARISKMSKEDFVKTLVTLGIPEREAQRQADKKYAEPSK